MHGAMDHTIRLQIAQLSGQHFLAHPLQSPLKI